jgi:hypothetical protein
VLVVAAILFLTNRYSTFFFAFLTICTSVHFQMLICENTKSCLYFLFYNSGDIFFSNADFQYVWLVFSVLLPPFGPMHLQSCTCTNDMYFVLFGDW